MNDLQIFRNAQFGEIRIVNINNEPWFVGKDVAEILGYNNPRDAVAKHIEPEDKGVAKCDTPGGQQDMTIINESGLYSLVIGSKLLSAKQFKRWITAEVLPAIRKTGGYVNNEQQFIETYLPYADDGVKALFSQTLYQLRAANAKIEEDRPKVLFADAVADSGTAILIGELAKLLKQNGVDIGQNRLFRWLRERGYLTRNNEPTQRSMEMELFVVIERAVNNSDGSNRITRTTKVTGKGQTYFVSKFLQNK